MTNNNNTNGDADMSEEMHEDENLSRPAFVNDDEEDLRLAEDECDIDYEDDGQPTEYEEWQDFMGGDDSDHGQYDDYDY